MFCFGSNKKFNNFNIYDKNITKKKLHRSRALILYNNLSYYDPTATL